MRIGMNEYSAVRSTRRADANRRAAYGTVDLESDEWRRAEPQGVCDLFRLGKANTKLMASAHRSNSHPSDRTRTVLERRHSDY